MKTLRALLRRWRSGEDGVVSLMTLGFMAGAGGVLILGLASIGLSSSVYNAQYQATQSAAYAAASSVVPGASGSSQAVIDCAAIDSQTGWCTQGAALDSARQSLAASLGTPATNPSAFGLFYDAGGSSVPSGGIPLQLVNQNDVPGIGIYVYNITVPYGKAKDTYYGPGGGSCVTDKGATRLCWQINDSNQTGDTVFQSGVVVRTSTSLRLPPGCSSFCLLNMPLVATAGATASSPLRP